MTSHWLGMAAIAVMLAGCGGATPPQPIVAAAKVTKVCPPEPPAGSGFVCAPATPCRLNPTLLELDNGPLGTLLPAKYRNAIRHFSAGVADLCGEAHAASTSLD